MGGEFSYRPIGNNNYEITLTLYRDCSGIAMGTFNTLYYSSATLSIQSSAFLYLDTTATTGAPEVCPNLLPSIDSACNANFGGSTSIVISYQKYVYKDTLQLPSAPDWTLRYSDCCRNAAITNLANPASYGTTLIATLNNLNGENYSPVFALKPVIFMCTGFPQPLNWNAWDEEGDSLVYRLTTPLDDSSQTVVYGSGFNINNPIAVNTPMIFDGSTGNMILNPSVQQVAALSMVVEEYRNGVQIGTIRRDLQLVIIASTNAPPVLSGINGSQNFDVNICVDSLINFAVYATNAETNQILSSSWDSLIAGAQFQWTQISGGFAGGTFSWRPDSSYSGRTINVNVLCNDNACPYSSIITRTYKIHVGQLCNNNITALPDTISLVMGETRRAFILGNDSGPINPASITLLNSPFHSYVSIDNFGTLTVTSNNFGSDTLFYSVCNLSQSICDTSFLIIYIADSICHNCVWPGDANYDGVVDQNDMLNIGLAYNLTGNARNFVSTNWQAFPCADWTDTLPAGLNMKHADCNGNGTVDANDTLAVLSNFALTHVRGNSITEPRSGLPTLQVKFSQAQAHSGDLLSAQINLGDSNISLNNVYGLAFDLNLSMSVINTASINTTLNNAGWLVIYNNPLFLHINDLGASIIHMAIVRTDHNAVSGMGNIASVNFSLQNNITGFQQLVGYVSNLKVIDNAGRTIDVNESADTVLINSAATGITDNTNEKISIYPVPAKNQLIVSWSISGQKQYAITNSLGETLVSAENAAESDYPLNIEKLAAGIYFLQVKCYSHTRTIRFVKQ